MNKGGSFRSLRTATLFVLAVWLLGMAGYMLIEHLSLLDAFYTTTAFMTTEGIVVQPFSEAGKIFTVIVMVLGVASLLYTFTIFMEYVLEGHLSLAIRRRFMVNKIASLRGHAIVCGFGRVGSQIVEDLAMAGTSFVVIDERESTMQLCTDKGYLTVLGDATSDDVLNQAGICQATSLLVATDNDAHNISITLSARHLSDKVYIVARANHKETEIKLKLAGANQVISPYTISGHRMANMALKPDAV